jgi:hypothetical protein
MTFKRWASREPHSWAYFVFKGYHHNLNRIIWSQKPVVDYIEKHVSITPGDIQSILGCKNEEKKTIRADKAEWKTDYKDFNNWIRLNALMSLSSCLEIYLSSIISLSIESDPGILHKASKKIDGAIILKSSDDYQYSDNAQRCLVGEWSKRIAEFNNIFNAIPSKLISFQGELEKIRILRNKVGHAFGRDIDDSRQKGVRQILEIERLSFDRLKKLLGIVNEVVLDVDEFLLKNHIGDYESVYHYHNLRKSFKPNLTSVQRMMMLKKSVGREGVMPASKLYCQELIDYYDNL